MATKKKKPEAVQELKERIERASAVILTEYRGLKAQDMNRLRRNIRQSQLEYKVVKNTLIRRAAEGTPAESAVRELSGPIAVLFGYDDPIVATRMISERASEYEPVVIKWGVIDGQFFDASQIAMLSKLPGRQEMLGRVVATAQSPVAYLVFSLQSVVQRLVGTLQSYADVKAKE